MNIYGFEYIENSIPIIITTTTSPTNTTVMSKNSLIMRLLQVYKCDLSSRKTE